MMTARWYRVLAIEGKDTKLDAYGNPTSAASQPERRLVALRGPQWPWEPAGILTYNDALSNALYVCIPTGAVAVHAKTIRLEGNSVWSGGAGGLGVPPRHRGLRTVPPVDSGLRAHSIADDRSDDDSGEMTAGEKQRLNK